MSKEFLQMTTDTDGTGGVGAWIPAEHFSDLILDGVVAYGQLSGKISRMNYDLAAGNGAVVKVRTVSPRTASPTQTTGCLSTVSTTFNDVPITIKPYGDMDVVQEWDRYRAKGDMVGMIVNEMSKALARSRDELIYDAIAASGATTVDTTASWASTRTTDSCCNFAFDIYNTIIDARQELMGAGYNPDTVLIHPYAASYLYYKENGNVPAVGDIMPLVKYGSDGYISSIAGMKVIEMKCAVSKVSDGALDDADANTAFVIDSSRAVGEAWGMRPKFHEFYDGQCNNTELTVWTYWGCDTLDAGAIRLIQNP